MRRSPKPYWAEHVPRRWHGTVFRRSSVAVLTTSALVGLTALAVGPPEDGQAPPGGACTGETRDRARALLADAVVNDDPRAQELARQIAGLGLTPATRPAGWQQMAVDVSDQLNGTTDPQLHAVAVRLAAAGYGPTPSDLRTPPPGDGPVGAATSRAGDVTLPAGCLGRVANTRTEPEPPDGRGGTAGGLLDELVQELTTSQDTEAAALSDAISEALVPEQVIDLQFDPADLELAPEPAAGDVPERGWQDGARSLVEQVDAAAATDPLAAELAATLGRLALAPGAAAPPARPATKPPGWEAGAKQLAAQVTAAAGVDPLARALSDRLTAAGFPAPDDRTPTSARPTTSATPTPGAPRSGTPSSETPSSETPTPNAPASGDAADRGDRSRSGRDDTGSDTTGPATGTDGGSRSRTETAKEPERDSRYDAAAPWKTGAELLVGQVNAAAGKDPLARELADRLTEAGFGSGRGRVDGATWDRLASCESGGDWSTDSGNGYSGGLQFAPATWKAFGGRGAAHEAGRAEQIAVAEKVLAAQGWEAWPVCSAELGLRDTPDAQP